MVDCLLAAVVWFACHGASDSEPRVIAVGWLLLGAMAPAPFGEQFYGIPLALKSGWSWRSNDSFVVDVQLHGTWQNSVVLLAFLMPRFKRCWRLDYRRAGRDWLSS